MTFQLELEQSILTSNLHKVRTSWKKANSDHIKEYKSNLDSFLSRIILPYDCLHCTDVLCTNNKHIESIQLLHDTIISTLIESIPTFAPPPRHLPPFPTFAPPDICPPRHSPPNICPPPEKNYKQGLRFNNITSIVIKSKYIDVKDEM